jgi:phosphoribosylamine--glycine ligase
MKILVIGSGGREHAFCWKIAQSSQASEVHCIPGNAGTARVATNHSVSLAPPFSELIAWVKEQQIDLTIVGPEDPLAQGIVDAFQAEKLAIFGPTKEAALIEASKSFAKDIMTSAGVPTAKAASFTDPDAAIAAARNMGAPVVIKADGLAAGKGVTVAQTLEEAERAINECLRDGRFSDAGSSLLVEECLTGREVSVFAICNGTDFKVIGTAEDHKQAYDCDTGPNTGGMGAYTPSPLMTPKLLAKVEETVFAPTLHEMQQRGIPYSGFLYAGLMITADGPKVIEFNCRMGDPETQVVFPLMQSDLLHLITEAMAGNLSELDVQHHSGCCLGVVMASAGYPGSYEKGKVVTGIDQVDMLPGLEFFIAGAQQDEIGQLVTSGGRVLSVSALGEDLNIARERAYYGIEQINFEDAHFRTDIGMRALNTSDEAAPEGASAKT